ncbi:unnamed protein product (macronuclear) [Paramecium tetraurelia]|uniref:Transmembrane protein n=1 Tax=Paramecium tetraurelia TaxID=5888 RepID=A0C343_PARTE|nr:uncharacterized protein GSPATT00034688001 [Paramecium tetraurelia]CAK65210.1 unnamed protein product [Paramecium tetraurelia]|eukprot:XP_001432607.1 hypothetical protein (macronuclear) [Paramecium tetraurelia strain d4-2]
MQKAQFIELFLLAFLGVIHSQEKSGNPITKFQITNCTYFDQNISYIPESCQNVYLTSCNFVCQKNYLILNVQEVHFKRSNITNCEITKIDSDYIEFHNINLINPNTSQYKLQSRGSISLQGNLEQQLNHTQLLIESQTDIIIKDAQINIDYLAFISHIGHIEISNSSITSLSPKCNMNKDLELTSNLKIVSQENVTIDSKSKITASTLILYSNNTIVDGVIKSPFDCYTNQGVGKAPTFTIEELVCLSGGGSSAGLGGRGSQNKSCQALEKTSKQFIKSHPYNHPNYLRSGSGGAGTISVGSGGGIILMQSLNSISINGELLCNGVDGQYIDLQNQFGGGGGGAIQILAKVIDGNGVIQAKGGNSDASNKVGEGGGGIVTVQGELSNTSKLKIDVRSGIRQDQQAQNGTIQFFPCEDGFHLYKFQCVECPSNSMSFAKRGHCFKCPGVLFGQQYIDWPSCNEKVCNQFHCDPITFISNIVSSLMNLILYLMLFMFVTIGYVIRRMYRMKEIKYEKLPFDFESATRYMTIDHLLTDELLKNNNFQLIDLMYHVHRITLLGNNSPENPWKLPSHPESGIEYLMDLEEYKRFANKINKLAEWKKQEKVLLIIFSILYYPLYWVILTYTKKKKYLKIIEYFHQSNIMKLMDDQFIKIKISKSADYTLLYFDIFNYKISDLKYFFLACPYYILVSGEGNFLKPFYLCESNPFLSCLYFSINRNKEIHEDRNKILDNLVTHKTRMENSQKLNNFIIKFNRYARAIDVDSNDFTQNVQQLIIFCNNQNVKFFSDFLITINIIIIIDDEFTILENYESQEFIKFIEGAKNKNLRLGLFIYDSEANPEEIEDVLDNQRISLEQSNQFQVFEEDKESFDNLQNLEDLKHQYIERMQDSVQSSQEIQQEQSKKSQNRKSDMKIFGKIRYLFLSHQVPSVGQNTKIYVQLLLAILDAIFLPLLIQQGLLADDLYLEQILLISFPYPLSILISPILGCVWMTTQSYGIAKAHSIFNTLSIFNLVVHIIVMIKKLIPLAFIILFINLILKILLMINIKRILSLNIKLNKLNQIKHIVQ